MWDQLSVFWPPEDLSGSVWGELTTNCHLFVTHSLFVFLSLSYLCVLSDPSTKDKTSDLSSKQTSFCPKLCAKFHLALFAFTDLTLIFPFFCFCFFPGLLSDKMYAHPVQQLIWAEPGPKMMTSCLFYIKFSWIKLITQSFINSNYITGSPVKTSTITQPRQRLQINKTTVNEWALPLRTLIRCVTFDMNRIRWYLVVQGPDIYRGELRCWVTQERT